MSRFHGVHRHLRRIDAACEEVVVTDLLEPLELAALERMLTQDDELHARVLRLLRDHEVDVDVLHIEVTGGRVSLGGCVRDHLTSLLVEDLVWLVPQVQQCRNALQVRRAA